MAATLFNALLLLFWLRFVPVSREEAIGNPLVSAPLNQADRLVDLIRPAFGSRASRPFTAFVLLALLVILRGAVVSAVQSPWMLSVGTATFACLPGVHTPMDYIRFSLLQFGWMIERLWMLVLLFGWIRRRRKPGMEDGLAQSLGLPVSAAPRWLQLLLVALTALVLSHATIRSGFSCPVSVLADQLSGDISAPFVEVLRFSARVFPDFRTTTPLALGLMMVGAFTEVFSVSVDVVVALVIASIIGIVMRWTYWLALGNAGLSYIVGAFFRGTMKWGGMSFAPLVYILIAGILYFVTFNVGTGLVLAVSGVFTPEVLDAFRKALESAAP